MPFAATWMDPETVIFTEVSQTENYMILLIHGIFKKKVVQMKLIYKMEIELQM